jgi:hypothetical protein
MLRILHINNRFNLGGPTHNVAFLARYMPPGFETLLIGGPPEGNEESSSHILSDLGVDAMIRLKCAGRFLLSRTYQPTGG